MNKFWSALEDIPGSTASLAEWRFRLDSEFENVKSLLIPTDKRAASIPVADETFARYRVVEHASDDIVGIRSDNGAEIPLAKPDILIYRLSRRHFVRRIATTFNWEAVDDPLDSVPHTSQAGTFRPFAGHTFPVYLTIPEDSRALAYVLEVVRGRSEGPFILLAPTDRYLRPDCSRIVTSRKACFLALNEAVEANSQGTWTATEAAKRQLAAFQETAFPATGGGAAKRQHAARREKIPAKSWTQADLDAAIRRYKAERAARYREIVDGVKAGLSGAKKAAQNLFGRNAVARALQVKAAAMVSKSPEWQAIAVELRLPHGKDRNRKISQRIGLDIAIEDQASEAAQTGLEIVVNNETIHLIRKSMSRAEAEPLIERLQRGDITDDQARELVEIVKNQKRDSRTRKVRSIP